MGCWLPCTRQGLLDAVRGYLVAVRDYLVLVLGLGASCGVDFLVHIWDYWQGWLGTRRAESCCSPTDLEFFPASVPEQGDEMTVPGRLLACHVGAGIGKTTRTKWLVRPFILRLGGGWWQGVDNFLVLHNLVIWLSITETVHSFLLRLVQRNDYAR